MAKAHRSSFSQKVSHISRIFPWNDAPDPVITSCYAMLLLIPASAPQVPGQIHMKLLFYACPNLTDLYYFFQVPLTHRSPTVHHVLCQSLPCFRRSLVPVHHWIYCAKRMTTIKRGGETEVRKGREECKQRSVREIKCQTKRQRKQ